MQLSKRMGRLASLVTEGNRLADVGTDHGYIPIALVQEGKIPSALAMDVNPGPLARAGEHIRQAGLAAYIEPRLSDGLQKLQAGEADTVLIAGMGGMLTVRILSGGGRGLDTVQELILQPQSDIHRVRQWLSEHDWQICTEDLVEEDEKYYPLMKAVRGRGQTFTEAELYYGKTKLQQSPKILGSYLKEKRLEYEKILVRLRQNGRDDTERSVEINIQLRMIEEIQKEVLNG